MMAEEPNIYGKNIPWEIPIQLIARDFIRQGDCVLDVGANIGGVAIALSRLVGTSGAVHAFEANPATLTRIRRDLAANNVSNVIVVDKAVSSTSAELRSFYCDASFYASASSLIPHANWSEIKVETITLDDYVRQWRLAPRLVKLDIEDAEFDALVGGSVLLKTVRPVVILEYYPSADSDTDALTYLARLDYDLLDTNLYEEVSRDMYLTRFSPVPRVNVVAIPRERRGRTPYRRISLEPLGQYAAQESEARFHLPSAGRYRIDAQVDGPMESIARLTVTAASGVRLAWYEAPVGKLKMHSCSTLVVEVDEEADIRCSLDSLVGVADLREIRVLRLCFARPARDRT